MCKKLRSQLARAMHMQSKCALTIMISLIRVTDKEVACNRVKPYSYCRKNIWEGSPAALQRKTIWECPPPSPLPPLPPLLHLPASCHGKCTFLFPFPFFLFHIPFLLPFFISHFLFPLLLCPFLNL